MSVLVAVEMTRLKRPVTLTDSLQPYAVLDIRVPGPYIPERYLELLRQPGL